MRNGILSMVVGLAALSAPMFGDISSVNIAFDKGVPTGTVNLFPGSAIGTGIDFQTMTVTGDPLYNGVYYLFGTGLGEVGITDGSAVVDFNTATGVLNLVGGVCELGSLNCNNLSDVLVNAMTLSIGTSPFMTITASSSTALSFSESSAQMAPALLTALGLPPTPFVLETANFTYTGGLNPHTITDPSLVFAPRWDNAAPDATTCGESERGVGAHA